MGQALSWTKLESWWNGLYGRWNQRRIWLYTNGGAWRVEVRQGDGDARVWSRTYATESEARQQMHERMEASRRQYGDAWRQLTIS